MSVQSWNPARYRVDAGFVAELGAPVLALLDPRPGERILDLGCGDGTLTRRLVEAGAEVVGVDASTEMVAAARVLGLDARIGNACSLEFDAGFDAVFSNAALHWIADHDAVLAGVRRALRPGGRFVAELGGEGNVAVLEEAMRATFAAHPEFGPYRSPWNFPSAVAFAARLRAAGFTVDEITLQPRPTPLPGELADWLAIFADAICADLDAAQRRAFQAGTAERARPRLFDPAQGWHVDYVRLRFVARRGEGT